jgi:hypothetical protein
MMVLFVGVGASYRHAIADSDIDLFLFGLSAEVNSNTTNHHTHHTSIKPVYHACQIGCCGAYQ